MCSNQTLHTTCQARGGGVMTGLTGLGHLNALS